MCRLASLLAAPSTTPGPRPRPRRCLVGVDDAWYESTLRREQLLVSREKTVRRTRGGAMSSGRDGGLTW
jgi:hypothetical protein